MELAIDKPVPNRSKAFSICLNEILIGGLLLSVAYFHGKLDSVKILLRHNAKIDGNVLDLFFRVSSTND